MQMDLQLGGERSIGLQRKIVRLGGKLLEQRVAVRLHQVAHFGSEHIFGAAGGGLANQSDALFQARFRQQPGAHLHHRSGEGEVVAHSLTFSPANSPSSLPARSSAYRASQPPTWGWPMKI